MLIKESWPTEKLEREDAERFAELNSMIEVITAIRKLRADQGVEPGKQLTVYIVDKNGGELFAQQSHHIMRMAKVEKLEIFKEAKGWKNIASAFLPGIEVHLNLEGLIDTEKELANLTKEQADLSKYVATLEAKLNDKKFADKAPEKVVAAEREKLNRADPQQDKFLFQKSHEKEP
jgi:valyl-tRNA synthetase